ncbi:MAG: mucoidy inhibitor MuiA family protein [Flavobacteriaceae bacterium]|nr:mucoidy inhibitor MuiA family protein [Flavobacteriaceae bacterium]
MKNQIKLRSTIGIASVLFTGIVLAQEPREIEVRTNVNEVTVFIEGAQVTRKNILNIPAGTSILKFTDLSPFINGKSLQFKADGNVTVLSVNQQQNYLEKLDKSNELINLEAQLESVRDKIKKERTYLDILSEEIIFLQSNKDIGGNQTLTAATLKSAADYFGTQLTALKLKELDRKAALDKFSLEERDLQNQINTLSGRKEYANGEVLVKLEAKRATQTNLELTYVVNNAGWFPSYDIRSTNVNEPVSLVYKANIKQDTKIDWKDVKLRLSSANPNISGTAPEMQTYFLDYNTSPPVYNRSVNEVSGVVRDTDNQPLPGAMVMVQGTSIGTTTNFDGFYSLALPSNANILEYSYIGYERKTLSVSRNVMNVTLVEDAQALEEVVVTGYSGKEKRAMRNGMVADASMEPQIKSIPLQEVENQTTVDFVINLPYTVNSDNKTYTVTMADYTLPATYQYYSIPKIEKEAYLISSIKDWEKYNLLEGEANIFFENTFVGKTVLDVRYATDTLDISLGKDKSVSVNREKITDFSSKKFVGTRKEESRAWKITVKNNKSQPISMLLLDQVPVSVRDEIKVEIDELSGGKHDAQTGEIKWELRLNSKEEKVFTLKYMVKYPRNRNLVIE